MFEERIAHDFALTVCERGLVFLPISEGTIRQQARTGHCRPACNAQWEIFQCYDNEGKNSGGG